MDRGEVEQRILLGLHHEAIVHRILADGLPGMVLEARIYGRWEVEIALNTWGHDEAAPRWVGRYRDLDDAILIVEQCFNKPLNDMSIDYPSYSDSVFATAADIRQAMVDGPLVFPLSLELRGWDLELPGH